jgi:hypothetical protein
LISPDSGYTRFAMLARSECRLFRTECRLFRTECRLFRTECRLFRTECRLFRSLLAAAILLTALPATASAAKKRFAGETAQSRNVRLVVNESGRVQRMVISWRANDCRRRGTFVRNVTVFRPLRRRASADAFRVAGTYRMRDKGGIRIRIRVSARGMRTFDPANPTAEQWSGTFRSRSTVRRHGRVVDRCRLRTTWVAGLPQAPPPSPPPSDPPAPVPGAWSVQFTGDQGDYISQGRSWSFGPPADSIQVTASRSLVTFSTRDWYGAFAAAPGQELVAGARYDGARRYPFNDAAPGLSISGDGRGCNELSGTFTVNRIEFDAAGALRAFEVTFEQHCEHMAPALRGTWTFAAA